MTRRQRVALGIGLGLVPVLLVILIVGGWVRAHFERHDECQVLESDNRSYLACMEDPHLPIPSLP